MVLNAENRALFLMDLGMPRNIDPAVADIYNVYLYSMEDLTEIVNQNRDAGPGKAKCQRRNRWWKTTWRSSSRGRPSVELTGRYWKPSAAA